jgi:hypothetical protein
MNNIFNDIHIGNNYANECINLINAYSENYITTNELNNELMRIRENIDRYEIGLNYLYHKSKKIMSRKMVERNNKNILQKFVDDKSLTLHYFDKEYKNKQKLELRTRVVKQLVMEMMVSPEFLYLRGNLRLYYGMYINRYLEDIDYTLSMLLHEMAIKHNHIVESLPPSIKNKINA